MELIQTNIKDLVVLSPRVFADERGRFHESYNQKTFNELVAPTVFVQDNISSSKKDTLRGLHLQVPPFAQAKLVSVSKGSVLDVAVDLRSNSTTYGSSFSVVLSEENHKQLFIPRGFAHGFIALEDDTIFTYKCDNFYSKDHETSIHWNDEQLAIDWGTISPILSEKDEAARPFSEFESPFKQ